MIILFELNLFNNVGNYVGFLFLFSYLFKFFNME